MDWPLPLLLEDTTFFFGLALAFWFWPPPWLMLAFWPALCTAIPLSPPLLEDTTVCPPLPEVDIVFFPPSPDTDMEEDCLPPPLEDMEMEEELLPPPPP